MGWRGQATCNGVLSFWSWDFSEYSRKAATEGEDRALAALEHSVQAWQPAAGTVQHVLEGVQSWVDLTGRIAMLMSGVCSVSSQENDEV